VGQKLSRPAGGRAVKELVCPHLLVVVNGRTPFTAAHHHQVWARYNAIEVWIKVKKIMVASPMFGVHSSTLQCSMFSKTTSRKRGKMGVLSFKEEEEEEEEELVLQTLDAPYFQSIEIEVGRGYTKLRDAIQGENSWSGMVRWLWNRHMDLSLRVVQGLGKLDVPRDFARIKSGIFMTILSWCIGYTNILPPKYGTWRNNAQARS